ncbi:Plant-specific TFIIB-related protein 1 [Ranunculus cassubicifolius]
MWSVKCPYCSGTQGRCATTPSSRSITECCSCGRVVEERQTQTHDHFLLRAQDTPLNLVTSDLASIPTPSIIGLPPHQQPHESTDEEDPFESNGFITTFSTWSLETTPLFARSSNSFSGHLAELERCIDSPSNSSGPVVVVDNLRAYLQIIDVSSILGLDFDISDHAFQLFRDCSSATCLRNRSVEALATAALVQAIREAQEPRTLQEISIAANLPQKEIGKYIKILGEALQLSQPINSNSIAVHMPRFCTLLQLNKSAQELATHIGEVVINKCFCTRRNPISISAAAIYLACQLEDKRKTQAEICKVTGLTEVTLRKVYKELLENWDDLLPANYTPAVPPEKAFPTTAITSGRSSTAPRVDTVEIPPSDKDKPLPEVIKVEAGVKGTTTVPFRMPANKFRGIDMNKIELDADYEGVIERDSKPNSSLQGSSHFPIVGSASSGGPNVWSFHKLKAGSSHIQFGQPPQISRVQESKGGVIQNRIAEARLGKDDREQ